MWRPWKGLFLPGTRSAPITGYVNSSNLLRRSDWIPLVGTFLFNSVYCVFDSINVFNGLALFSTIRLEMFHVITLCDVCQYICVSIYVLKHVEWVSLDKQPTKFDFFDNQSRSFFNVGNKM